MLLPELKLVLPELVVPELLPVLQELVEPQLFFFYVVANVVAGGDAGGDDGDAGGDAGGNDGDAGRDDEGDGVDIRLRIITNSSNGFMIREITISLFDDVVAADSGPGME